MSDVETRIDLGVRWLQSHVAEGPEGTRGWGWVPDVPANPQNTAEVVWALIETGRPVPDLDDVTRLIRLHHVDRGTGARWSFDEVIDTAWRLRALRQLGVDDMDTTDATRSLLASQDSGGGWRMGSATSAVSPTATRVAVLALAADPAPAEAVVRAVRAGARFLATATSDAALSGWSLYASAQIADTFSRPQLMAMGGFRARRAHAVTVQRIRDALTRGVLPVEEEPFVRGGFRDSWRHTSLSLSLTALVRSDPGNILLPEFRSGLVHLLDLQEVGVDAYHLGGFRTSEEGFVTSYATTQALELMTLVSSAVTGQVNPARTFDYICSQEGAHHSDPRDLVRFRHYRVAMNSTAGALTMFLGVAAGATILVLALQLQDSIPIAEGRGLVVWSLALITFALYTYVTLRLPQIPDRVVAAAAFTVFTAIALPVITYLLS